MKNQLTMKNWATALSAAALTLLLMPALAQASPHGGRSVTVAVDDRGAAAANDNHGRGRGRGADDGANHDATDNRGAVRNGADDPANHNAGDDNNNNRRRGR